VNDLIMLVLFVPIVQFLVTGASSLTVPFGVLLYSVMVFILIPLLAGTLLRAFLIRKGGKEWLEKEVLPRFAPVTITALLATLVFIFAFQADNITNRFFHVILIAVPITLQVYLNSSLAYGLMRFFKVEHTVAAPGALIGASNFLRACGRDGDCSIRPPIRSGTGNRGGRIGGGSRDAVRLRGMQPDPPLVLVPNSRVEPHGEEGPDPLHWKFRAKPNGGGFVPAGGGWSL
jgi:hypothetical protein